MKSQSLWLIKKNKPKILSKDIYYKKNDKTVLVKTLYSGVSKGTESLVTSGKVHKSQYEIMRCPFQDGTFGFPIKYGYINIGQIIDGPKSLTGKKYLHFSHIKLFLRLVSIILTLLKIKTKKNIYLQPIWKLQ